MTAETDPQPAGMDFPCEYQVKAMGHNDDGFHELVLRIVSRHCPDAPPDARRVQRRVSRTGKYVSVSVVIEARSMAQLDAIYAELTSHEQVLARL